MDIIKLLLDLEILVSPSCYNRLKSFKEVDLENLISKISKFKNSKKDFILLDNHFIDLFLKNDVNDIISEYSNFDFLKYYMGSKTNIEFKSSKTNLDEKLSKEYNIIDLEIKNEKIQDKSTKKIEETKKQIIVEEEKSEAEIQRDLKLANRLERFEKIKSIRKSVNSSFKFDSKDIETQVKVYKDTDVTGNSTCEGTLDDFITYFRDRYETLKTIIERKYQKKAYPLTKAYTKKNEKIFIVGIISDVNVTKNGHKMIEIEDQKGDFKVLIMKNKIDNKEIYGDILLDEIMGFEGTVSNDGRLMFVDKTYRPDVDVKPTKKIDEEIYTAFLSDVHVGSHEFMAKTFEKFVRFLNGDVGNSKEQNIASKLKYVSIAGDLVDGVGIYPGQEEDLYEVDIISQYEEVANYLAQVPEHIHFVICPGNHDALRPAEPQPTFSKEVRELFPKENVTFVSNPCSVNVHGLDFLLYHGRSFDDVIGQISEAQYTNPCSIMKELLKRRHLCPTYGGRCPIAPEIKDYLIIDKKPDVFHTGHIHINGCGNYKGVVMVNSGTFQEQTSFQKKMGIAPTPAIVPIMDMSNMGNVVYEWNKGEVNSKLV
ncbi:DNA-directed DNA polymerase II small subunit [Methanococcus voltae]|uniref:DNA-directed DNA polymerase II small subunit n=1 Tax=Methanococcus voltae TaxID=2188 RepID=UPI001FD88748|nr:DNA-directed DNA polymerase II small subunit [Methanococcus voltae]MBP2172720.1 DNA polymerase II small subunit [Methanococcus voltae]